MVMGVRFEGAPRTKRASTPMPALVVVMLVLMGIGASWLLVLTAGAQRAFDSRAQGTEGQVVALKERTGTGKGNGTVYVPVFRFTAADGRSVDSVGGEGSNPPAWKIGETTRLLYDPASPTRAIPDTFWGRWGAVFLLSLFTLCSFAGALLCLRTRAWRLF